MMASKQGPAHSPGLIEIGYKVFIAGREIQCLNLWGLQNLRVLISKIYRPGKLSMKVWCIFAVVNVAHTLNFPCTEIRSLQDAESFTKSFHNLELTSPMLQTRTFVRTCIAQMHTQVYNCLCTVQA